MCQIYERYVDSCRRNMGFNRYFLKTRFSKTPHGTVAVGRRVSFVCPVFLPCRGNFKSNHHLRRESCDTSDNAR